MRILASAAALYILAVSSNVCAMAKAPAADNTAQNKGATQQDAVNADKQAMDNKKSDVKVLAAVRKSIVDQKELSMDAKNCKLRFYEGRQLDFAWSSRQRRREGQSG